VCVHEPSRLGDTHITLPIQLHINFFIIGVLICNDCLLVYPIDRVSIRKEPLALLVWLIVSEFSLVVSTIGEYPSARYNLIFGPLPDQLHAAVIINVCSFAIFLTKLPPTRVGVLVGIKIGTFTMLDPVLPLAYIKI
jgi:hypothetical protein